MAQWQALILVNIPAPKASYLLMIGAIGQVVLLLMGRL
jgi:hypothetical protein